MCVSPATMLLQSGARITVPCRRCWQCLSNRKNNYVGRMLCEQATSEWTAAITLTYAPTDTGADKVLNPRHFQFFMRRLREKFVHTQLRYFVAGEYGELHGRAHFHVVLFGVGPRPEIPQNQMFHWKFWPHGHCHADNFTNVKAMKYVAKYVVKGTSAQKRTDSNKMEWASFSKKPALGASFFAQLAERQSVLGVLPRDWLYLAPGQTSKQRFQITGATRREFIRAMLIYENNDQPGRSPIALVGHENNDQPGRSPIALVGPMRHRKPTELMTEAFWRYGIAEMKAVAKNLPLDEMCRVMAKSEAEKALTRSEVEKIVRATNPDANVWADFNNELRLRGVTLDQWEKYGWLTDVSELDAKSDINATFQRSTHP